MKLWKKIALGTVLGATVVVGIGASILPEKEEEFVPKFGGWQNAKKDNPALYEEFENAKKDEAAWTEFEKKYGK